MTKAQQEEINKTIAESQRIIAEIKKSIIEQAQEIRTLKSDLNNLSTKVKQKRSFWQLWS